MQHGRRHRSNLLATSLSRSVIFADIYEAGGSGGGSSSGTCCIVRFRLHPVVLRRGSVQLTVTLESLPLLDAQISLLLAEVCQRLVGGGLQTRKSLAQRVELAGEARALRHIQVEVALQ
jgi:hypothetical protein